jgi:hypothetical protein
MMEVKYILILVLAAFLLPDVSIGENVGTRTNPVPLHSMVTIGDWQVGVVDVIPDATQQVLAANMFNSKPKPGHQYFMARVEGINVGQKEQPFNLNLNALGASLMSYYSSGLVVPDPIPSPGGKVQGNVVFNLESISNGLLALKTIPSN